MSDTEVADNDDPPREIRLSMTSENIQIPDSSMSDNELEGNEE